LSLIECGDGFGETERQLDQWRVPGPIAVRGGQLGLGAPSNRGRTRARRGLRRHLRSGRPRPLTRDLTGGPSGPSCGATGR
jgi:hypothetical protein